MREDNQSMKRVLEDKTSLILRQENEIQELKRALEELTQNNKMRKDIGRMKKELEDKISALQCMQNEIQKMRKALEEQKARKAQMIQILTGLKAEGQSFSSSGQMSNWLLSRTYEQNHQGPDNPSITASDPRSSLVANNTGFDAPNNNLSSCDPPAGPDNTNITASDPRFSFVANNIAFDAPNSNLSYPAAGLLDSVAGSSFHSNDDDCLSDWIMEMLKPDAAAGLLDSGAGSSHANDDDCLSAWIKEMSKPDAAAAKSSAPRVNHLPYPKAAKTEPQRRLHPLSLCPHPSPSLCQPPLPVNPMTHRTVEYFLLMINFVHAYYVSEIANGDEQVKADAIRIGNYTDGSELTKMRAKVLADEIGSWHLDVCIDGVVSSLLALFQTLAGKRPLR
ncbi:hypothetical protein CRYUN_Cryun19dG0109300 [Craigia yunnanensis]